MDGVLTAPAMPEVAGVSHSWHEARGLRFHVAEAGAGPPVLLLHGFPAHWYMWHRVIGPLAEDYRVIVPDLRGFGWSDAPESSYDKETLGKDMLALLEAMDVQEPVRIAGHDWGTFIAYLMAMRAPERVDRILATGFHHPFWEFGPKFVSSIWTTWHGMVMGTPPLAPRALDGTSWLSRRLLRWLGDADWDPEDRRIFLEQFRDPARVRAANRLYQAVRQKDMPRVLSGRYREKRLTTPTLLLKGRRDRVIPKVTDEDVGPYTDDFRIEWVDAGHAIVEERPELVVQYAREFFAQ